MMKTGQYLFITTIGGSIYYSFELLFRGFSHWTMYLLGGICFLFMYVQGKILYWRESMAKMIFKCTVFIASTEFITGIIVNKFFKWNVWDYSDQPFNLFGQICVPFTIIFSGLSAIGIILSGYIGYWFFGEEKPHFHIL